MVTQIKKIGNSRGVVIPAQIMRVLGLKKDDKLTIELEGRTIKLTKNDDFNPKTLEELFIEYQESFKSEIVFDDVKGREIW